VADRQRRNGEVKKVGIFGYGSLISKTSFEYTLGRSLSDYEFSLGYLNGYARSWTLFHKIKNYPKEKRLLMPLGKKYIVYLDITPMDNSRIMGSIVNVSDQEILRFDNRERNYDRVDVTKNLGQPPEEMTVYSYIGDEKHKTTLVPTSECVIVKEYISTIENGLESFDVSAKTDFWNSTIQTDIDVVSIPGFYGR
jgi:cation transport regulator ChaC